MAADTTSQAPARMTRGTPFEKHPHDQGQEHCTDLTANGQVAPPPLPGLETDTESVAWGLEHEEVLLRSKQHGLHFPWRIRITG
ncbi:hypothetical protein D187_002295 [Cystobacter fuscus DSM 2262]|uniref:Uncharacterized protein n=1 Tax=Cystobacter fuscus (strain ATCC 25194 / DSM 2262 / NBRC 100088 / M29) TaxID=1242864 RepID=S9QFX9_CYSF2|nr:hypothetical protein D187_002295 [Cystobacter fuscus DSM 2262]